jgi:hypothetical protein
MYVCMLWRAGRRFTAGLKSNFCPINRFTGRYDVNESRVAGHILDSYEYIVVDRGRGSMYGRLWYVVLLVVHILYAMYQLPSSIVLSSTSTCTHIIGAHNIYIVLKYCIISSYIIYEYDMCHPYYMR